MTDDLLDLDPEETIINREQSRNKVLSEKYSNSEKEKAEIAKAKEEAEVREKAALREVDFYKDFNKSTSQYPGASEYQDVIKEKVMSGYTVEDATVAVLAKEGKLTQTSEAKESAAGGSATTNVKGGVDKPLAEMTQAEKREMLSQNLAN